MAETSPAVKIAGMQSPVVTRAPAIIPGGMVASVHFEATMTASVLHPEESALAESLSESRRAAFVAGRLALRAALSAAAPGLAVTPLLRTGRGGPLVQRGASGSISHKRTRAIALAAPEATGARHIGIDLEHRPSADSVVADHSAKHRSLAERILTSRELDALHALDALAYREATVLRFALKEAVYKAIDPEVQRYVGFKEVELDVGAELVQVTLLLPERPNVAVRASWWMDDEWIVATAVSERR